MNRKSGIRSVIAVVVMVALLVGFACWRDWSAERRRKESVALTTRVNEAILPLLEAHILVQKRAAEVQEHSRLHAGQPLATKILDSANAQIKKSAELIQSIERTCTGADLQAQKRALPRDSLNKSLKLGQEAVARHRFRVEHLKSILSTPAS